MSLTIACVFVYEEFAAFGVAGPDPDMLILPELCDGGYARLHRDHGASSDFRSLLNIFAQFSRARDTVVIGGSVATPAEGGRVFNAAHVYAKGELVARFDKVHLFRPLGDDQFFTPGTPRPAVTVATRQGPVRLGVMICYDLRFPELARPWFKDGIDLIVVPARWPRVRDDAWKTLLQARAIENQCFCVGVDARDDEGGGTYAFGPAGAELAALGPEPSPDDPAWITFTIDLDEITRVKKRLDTRIDARLL